MKIFIDGYKNLQGFETEIIEKKINVLFGMSGSGKSAIGEALNHIDIDFNKTVNRIDDPIIKVNDTEVLPNIAVYNTQSVDELLMTEEANNIFDVIVDDNKSLRKAEKNLRKVLENLKLQLEAERLKYNECIELKNSLGSNPDKSNKLRKTSKAIKISDSIKKPSDARTLQLIQSLEKGKFSWLLQGRTFQKNKRCPYCEKIVSQKLIKKLDRFSAFEEKALQNISTEVEKHPAYFSGFDYSIKAIKELTEFVRVISVACNAYKVIADKAYELENYTVTTYLGSNDIVLNDELKKCFPLTYKAAKKLLDQISAVNGAIRSARNSTKAILARQLNAINKTLSEISVPYNISAEYCNGKIVSYKLTHKVDTSETDRRKGLSTGEKNIIALIMFVLKCRNKKDAELIIIDDPVSAFDDYRRNQIFNYISKKLNGKTILLLSHDSVFAKYAVVSKQKGKVLYFENHTDGFNVTEVTKDDFGIFEDYLKNRIIHSTDYWQKIVNLRLLYEGDTRAYAYGYLSAIIHRYNRDEIDEIIREKNTTEEGIHKLMIDKYPWLKGQLQSFDDSVKPSNVSSWSLIEKAFIIREFFPDDVSQHGFSEELNEFIHINKKLRVCLDPYRFAFCTDNLASFVKSLDIDLKIEQLQAKGNESSEEQNSIVGDNVF